MGANIARSVLSFLIPGGLLFAAVIIGVQQPDFTPLIPSLERVYPYTVFGVALLFGWRFDRSRLVFAAMVIGLAGYSISRYGASFSGGRRHIFDAVAVLLPINLGMLALVKERGIFTWHGLLRWAFILSQPVAIALIIHYGHSNWLRVFEARVIPASIFDEIPIRQPALLAFAVGIAATGLNSLRHRNALENGFFWALALMLFALLTAKSAALITIYFATAILILVIAVVEISYGMAFRDDLTGLPGRRALNQALLKLGSRYTIAMLDIDHFKKFNDRYGHDVGDQVLRMVATQLAKVTGGGKAFRYGGEEFTILFPGKHVDDVSAHAERLRAAVESAEFVVRNWNRPKNKPAETKQTKKKKNKKVTITVSIGLAERNEKNATPQEVIKTADKALYKAKKGGRNRVAK